MIADNRQLVTNEPVEFEKQLVEVHHCSKLKLPITLEESVEEYALI